ncbi:MAG: DUF2332 domain-containing protein [Sphingobacteriales bacterium]|nr:DUF2332 domain-containing protein [Sphingobacteriales bacterium]
MDLVNTKGKFISFAESECKGNSELYYKLSKQVSGDDTLLKIAATAKAGQPVPNIFLAAVHYLLLKNPGNGLAAYYPSIGKKQVPEIPFPLFRSFCLDNEAVIREIILTRIVQTNVINRCAYLLPVFSKIITEENRPATIIDIGTSAGLTLNFDKYEYWYNNQKVYGDSKVIIKSKITGSTIPALFPITQPIQKIGIDQNIIDPADTDQIIWLKALIWPDQAERFIAMEEALKTEELKKIEFFRAETIPDFEAVILNADKAHTLIIYATHVLYQFPQTQKEAFDAMLERVGQSRDFYFLSVEGTESLLQRYQTREIVIELTQFRDKKKSQTLLAETNGHGNWIKWV